ncbi:galactose-specific lectin nattectin isoform X1 [Etheostoma spectabile]|uniref:galactose-specific lectin nattectin isoform X1 n=1 Tax=Etheostoma spectabile TaxID=54343 RepID=UPI0013AE9632|nr:galactose-specific lectin nattectin-like isoform X1 [Etheostoma spectabile]
MSSVFLISVCLCLSSGLLAAYGTFVPCPPGWTQSGSRCFGYFNQPRTWADAETACISFGGNLASIRSAAEHAFLKDFIVRATGTHKTTWIGGHDSVKEGTWMWSDGSTFNYRNWNAGEPNNCCGGEHCLTFNWGPALCTGNWNDYSCNNQVSFVCSRDVCV